MTIRTTTEIWPVCRVGSYDGDVLDPQYVMNVEGEQESMDEEGTGDRIVPWEFDCDAWDKAVVEAAQKAFDENMPLEQHGVKSVKVTKYWHPREYNFVSDCLYVNVEVDDVNDFVRNASVVLEKEEHKKLLSEYIDRHWHSCDGFLSNMSETYDEFFDDMDTFLSEDDEDTEFHCVNVELFLGEVLTLLSLVDNELDNSDEDFYGSITGCIVENLSANHSASEFFLTYNKEELLARYGLQEVYNTFTSVKNQIDSDVHEYLKSFESDSDQAKKAKEWQEKAKARLVKLENELDDWIDNNVRVDCVDGKYDYSKVYIDETSVQDKVDEINRELETGLKID